jgi:hypothetical protein
LAHLNKKRTIAIDRLQFFIQAEVFAYLVKLDFIPIDGMWLRTF